MYEHLEPVAEALKVVAPLLGYAGACYTACYAFWKRMEQDRSAKESKRSMLIAEAKGLFADNPAASQFFHNVQLQHTIEQVAGFAPPPAEFEAVFRFFREEQSSLWDLKQAWKYREPSLDGKLTFKLDIAATIWLWSQLLYSICCFIAGVLLVMLACLQPGQPPLQAFGKIVFAFALMLIAILPAYAIRPEAAVRRIERRRLLKARLDRSKAVVPTAEESVQG